MHQDAEHSADSDVAKDNIIHGKTSETIEINSGPGDMALEDFPQLQLVEFRLIPAPEDEVPVEPPTPSSPDIILVLITWALWRQRLRQPKATHA